LILLTQKLIVIDDPVKVRENSGRQKAPWRNSTVVQNMKRQCRRAEHMWRKTKHEAHYNIYKDSIHAFNIELGKATDFLLKQRTHSLCYCRETDKPLKPDSQ